jgi:hypothetical protein
MGLFEWSRGLVTERQAGKKKNLCSCFGSGARFSLVYAIKTGCGTQTTPSMGTGKRKAGREIELIAGHVLFLTLMTIVIEFC